VESDIEGVVFDEDKIILLLKNGEYWSTAARSIASIACTTEAISTSSLT
jgi:hypothetical protein